MFEATKAGRPAPFEDRRMWRLLLARLHPDAGGDHDLFTFACAVRDEVSGGVRAAQSTGPEDEVQDADGSAVPFLKPWQDAMGHWSSTNRDALKNLWAG